MSEDLSGRTSKAVPLGIVGKRPGRFSSHARPDRCWRPALRSLFDRASSLVADAPLHAPPLRVDSPVASPLVAVPPLADGRLSPSPPLLRSGCAPARAPVPGALPVSLCGGSYCLRRWL